MYVPQGKLRLCVWKKECDSHIAGHKGERKKPPKNGVMEGPLAVHKGGHSPLCEGLDEVPSEASLLQKATRFLATVAYPVGPWHSMCMDLITSFPESHVYDAI